MIIGYVGTPGSGKSYEAVKRIIENLKKGRIVLTNVKGTDTDIHVEAIKSVTGLDDISGQLFYITDNQMRNLPDHVDKYPGALIIIDEVHKLFSNREWATKENKSFCDWASTHRHGGFDILLITQDIEKIDKHARSLIEWVYFYRKMNYFGGLVQKKYRRFSYDSDNHSGKPIATDTYTYDTSIFKCYKSYDAIDTKEIGIQKNLNIFKHPVFYAIPVVLCVLIYFGSKSSLFSGDLLGSGKIAENTSKVQTKKGLPPSSGAESLTVKTDGKSQVENMPLQQQYNHAEMYTLSDGTIHLTDGVYQAPAGVVLIDKKVLLAKIRIQEKQQDYGYKEPQEIAQN